MFDIGPYTCLIFSQGDAPPVGNPADINSDGAVNGADLALLLGAWGQTGGSADVMGRAIAAELSKAYNQSVIVENRGGAGGNLGAEAVAKSPADGYTLLFGTIGIHAAYKIYPKLGYDPAKDLQAVNLLAELPNILIVHPGFAAQTLKDYMTIASQQPGTIFFG